jgi:hypothetical protein
MRRVIGMQVVTIVIIIGLLAAGASVVTPQKPVGAECGAHEVLVRISTTWVCLTGSLPK